MDLIKRTVANGATDAELRLFLFDCQRRGIHPLDKLLHFTKRGGKYTPVTSIDFMRSQAAMSGEMAGSDDPVFSFVELDGTITRHPQSATVTVYRLTQGQRFAYAATARWSEYCPDNAPMWRRMPHTMLGKCAEALALRKAFPQQLAGLYSSEEMDQAGEPQGYTVTAPAPAPSAIPPANARGERENVSEPKAGASAISQPGDEGKSTDGPDLLPSVDDLPAEATIITKIDVASGGAKGWLHHAKQKLGEPGLGIYQEKLVTLATQLAQTQEPVIIEMRVSRTSLKCYVTDLKRLTQGVTAPVQPVTAGEIPF